MTETVPTDERGNARYRIREALGERPHGRKLKSSELVALADLLAE